MLQEDSRPALYVKLQLLWEKSRLTNDAAEEQRLDAEILRVQEKLRELDAEKIKLWHQNGLLPLIYAHLMSLDLMRFIFAKQTEQGKGPAAELAKPN